MAALPEMGGMGHAESIRSRGPHKQLRGSRNGAVTMFLDQGDVVQMALILIVVAVLIIIVLPYFSGRGRR